MTLEELSCFRELMGDFGWGIPSADAITQALWRAEERGYMTLGDLAFWGEWQLDCFDWFFYAAVGRPKHQGEDVVDFLIPYFATQEVTVDRFINKMEAMMRRSLEATS